jgi:hypothetical protein
MGWFSADEPTSKAENTGTVNNNVTITDTVNIHNDHVVLVLYLIAAIKIAEVIYVLFKTYNKKNKKKYVQRGISMKNLDNV